MKIKVGNYKDEFREIDLKDINPMAILVDVITGDEEIKVIYRDEDEILHEDFYGCGGRTADFPDGSYLIDPLDEKEFVKWNSRISVYDYLYGYSDYDEDDED